MKLTPEQIEMNAELQTHNDAIEVAQEIERERRERFEMAEAVASNGGLFSDWIKDATGHNAKPFSDFVVFHADAIIAELEKTKK